MSIQPIKYQKLNSGERMPVASSPREQVPNEIWMKIFAFLSNEKDLLHASLTCRLWYVITNDSHLLGKIREIKPLLRELFKRSQAKIKVPSFVDSTKGYSPHQKVIIAVREEVIEYDLLREGRQRTLCLTGGEYIGTVVDCGNGKNFFHSGTQLRIFPYGFDSEIISPPEGLSMTIPLMTGIDYFPYAYSETKCAIIGLKGNRAHILIYNFSESVEKTFYPDRDETSYTAAFPKLMADIQLPNNKDASTDYLMGKPFLTEDFVFIENDPQVLCYSLADQKLNPKYGTHLFSHLFT